MTQFDIIVVGGGVNSLVTAALMGKAGKSVLLLEAKEKVGGLATTVEFSPGFTCNLIHDIIKWIDPRVMTELDLEANGLELNSPDVVRIALGDDGDHITFHQDSKQTENSIASYSEKDATAWKEFTVYIEKLTHFLEKLYALTPPRLPGVGMKDALAMRSMLGPFAKHGSRGLVDLLRVVPMMMPELVDEWFENELLRSAVSTAGIHHLSFGPFAAATGYNLLHQHLYSDGVFHNAQTVEGGTGNFANALKTAAESHHVEIQTNSKVISIDMDNGTCTGVTLYNGKSVKAKTVVSGLDPQNTFINLVGAPNLSPNFHTQLRNIKYRGSAARIHFSLESLPEINGVSANQMGTVFSICPTIEYLERASDAVKYGRLSENPYVEFNIPTVTNPDFAPEGKHVLSATVQYTPYHLRGQKWNDELKSLLKKNVVRVLEKTIPGFSSIVESSTVVTPLDLENEFGLTEGNLNHGEMTLDQFMFMRPTISTAQYKSPIENLYLCGSGTHPGGGLHGANGFNAAREILKG